MNSILLPGCTPIPLAHYLKALGVLRLVSEQLPAASARGRWHNDVFVLDADLDEAALVRFFLEDYRPTPIFAPWNAGSGFYFRERKSEQKDPITGKKVKTGVRDEPTAATKVVSAVLSSATARLEMFRHSLKQAQAILASLDFTEAPEDEEKVDLIQRLRNIVDDNTLGWLNAALVLTTKGISFPPLLGTGGNGGNMDFTSNFMQRLSDIFDFGIGRPTVLSSAWLRNALFAVTTPKIPSKAFGQFSPGGGGGVNAGPGFSGGATVNPWDFILLLEGALLFAVASVKRLGVAGDSVLAAPFTVRKTSIGYASSASSDEDDPRGETWMPLWDQPVTAPELQALLSEGRAQVGNQPAKSGTDLMRAVVSLGVDRGIASFQRYGFHKRNGDLHFAVPLERVAVRRNAQVDLLADVEDWMHRFRSKAASTNPKPPGSVARALRVLEDAIFSLCRDENPASVQQVLIALGRCEKAMARSLRWSRSQTPPLQPIVSLSKLWRDELEKRDLPEFRLAYALASTTGLYGNSWLAMRTHLEAVKVGIGHDKKPWVKWLDVTSNDVLWHEGSPIDVMNGIFARRLMRAEQAGLDRLPDQRGGQVRLSDIADFIERRIDDGLFADLLWGCLLIERDQRLAFVSSGDSSEKSSARSHPFFALLKLAFAGQLGDGIQIPLHPAIHRRAAAGDAFQASQMAVRRLRASGVVPAIKSAVLDQSMVQRAAAALLFPLDSTQLLLLWETIARPNSVQTA